MTWMSDAETFYRERDEEIRTIVQRLEGKSLKSNFKLSKV